jgi:hypothetical protein
MSDASIGRIVRLHATVLGVLLATAMPAFATTAPALTGIDGMSLSAGVGLFSCGLILRRLNPR